MKATKKYVWLNVETGKFSSSWSEDTHSALIIENLIENCPKTLKLISYTCENDSEFEFNQYTKLK